MLTKHEEERIAALINGQTEVLRLIAKNEQLSTILDAITNWIESMSDGLLASILLTDNTGSKLLHGSAPSLPMAYNEAIHGIDIGPTVGSCGTAAYTKKRVIVEDIATDPLWTDFKDLALSYGLHACWSSPLINQHEQVRGTFAVYYKETRKPSANDYYIIELVSQVALLAIEKNIFENERIATAERERTIYRELEKSEQNFRNLVMQAPVGICIVSGDSVVVETVNNHFLELVGKKREEFENKEYWKELAEAAPYYAPILTSVMETGNRHVGKEAPVTLIRNGKEDFLYVSFVYEPILGTNGVVEKVMILGIDVTEQVAARKSIEESEQQVRSLVESAPFPIGVYTGKEKRIQLANKAIMDVWGKGYDVVGKLYTDLLPELQNQQIFQQVDRVIETGIPFHAKNERVDLMIEGRLQPFYFNYSFTPLYDGDGKVYGIMNTAADVTDLNLAMKKIEEGNQLLYNFFTQVPASLCILKGAEHIYEFANDGYMELIGWKENIIGKPVREVLPELQDQGFFELLDNVFVTGKSFVGKEMPVILMKKDGRQEESYQNFIFQAFRDMKGMVEGILVFAYDVTAMVTARREVEASEAELKRFKHMADNAKESFILLRGDGSFSYLNKIALERWGYQSYEIENIHLRTIDRNFDDRTFQDLFHRAQQDKIPPFETVHSKKDGGEFPVEITMGGLELDGKPYVFAIASDITERKEIEREIKDSEELFRNFSNNITNLAWMAAADGWIYWYNEKWYDYTGTTLEEMQGWGWSKVHHPDHLQRIVDYVKDAWNDDKAFELTFPLREKDGNYRWFLTRVVPIKDSDGNVVRWIGTNTDVHEQVLAEERFRSLAETLPQLVWMTDTKGNYEYVSPQWAEFTEINPVVAGIKSIVHPEDLEPMRHAWERSRETGETYKIEARLLNRSGNFRWHYAQGVPILDDQGVIHKWIGAFTDIHDQKTISERLERLVAERTIELQRSNDDLQQFAHVASHDLKEPLRKIKTFTGRLAEDSDSVLSMKARSYLTKMNSATNRMFAMVEGVLTYSTINASEQKTEEIDLNDIIKHIQQDLELLIEQKKARIEYHNLPKLEGGQILIYQLFYNLINNSLKFSHDNRSPVINIRAKGDPDQPKHVEIILSDNGIGFHNDHALRIFDTFARLNSKDRFEGTGLGLSLCKKIVHRHGGSIKAKGRPGNGADFIISLPYKQKNIKL